MIDFKGRIVLITGAARGLGYAYALAIGSLGATVIVQDIGADKSGLGTDSSVVHAAVEGLWEKGISAFAVSTPIATRDSCHEIIEDCIEKYGKIDAIIHNAGWVTYQTIEEVDQISLDHMLTIAVKAPLWLTQAAWPFMKKAAYGRILLTTSDRALYPQYVKDGLVAYAAAKMATVGIMNVLASEGRPVGIIVNAISPVAKTRMWGVEGEPDDLRPGDVAAGAAYLASEACTEAGWILRASNGQFHATRATEALGVVYPQDLKAVKATSVDEIAANWSKIAIKTIEAR